MMAYSGIRMSINGFKIGPLEITSPLVMAPLSGVTSHPTRILAKRHGAGLVVTGMVSAAGLCQSSEKTIQLMASTPEERPLAVQLFGASPEWMARGAALAQEAGADVIDLNMGCPVRKVIRHGAGSALLKDFPLIKEILAKVRPKVTVPLTVKTRLGWSPGHGELIDLLPILADAGVDGLTVHARWAVQKFSGRADRARISRVVEMFPGPVIGNGDVTSYEHVIEMMSQTGCAGVMIGRGAMGNPWIFSQALDALNGRPVKKPDLRTRLTTARSHAEMLKEHFGPDKSVFMLRSVLMWYSKGLRNSARFRRRISRVKDFDFLMEILDEYYKSLEIEGDFEPEVIEVESQVS